MISTDVYIRSFVEHRAEWRGPAPSGSYTNMRLLTSSLSYLTSRFTLRCHGFDAYVIFLCVPPPAAVLIIILVPQNVICRGRLGFLVLFSLFVRSTSGNTLLQRCRYRFLWILRGLIYFWMRKKLFSVFIWVNNRQTTKKCLPGSRKITPVFSTSKIVQESYFLLSWLRFCLQENFECRTNKSICI